MYSDWWIPATLTAAALQAGRTALQRKLAVRMSSAAASFARSLYGSPIAVMAAVFAVFAAEPPHSFGMFFWFGSFIGALGQAFGTLLLVYALTHGNFAVATTYSKTETIQVALFSALILAEPLSLYGWLAVVVGFMGVWILATRNGRPADGWWGRVAWAGLAAGACLGLSSVGIRMAAVSLDPAESWVRAVMTLAAVNVMQVVGFGLYFQLRDPKQLIKTGQDWRNGASIGLMSVIGSACWFFAMTVQSVAYVRALGQVELFITFAVSRMFFAERTTARDVFGIAVVGVSVIVLLVWGLPPK